MTFVAIIGCNDLTGTPPLPAGVQSPSAYNTPSGALGQARGVLSLMRGAFPNVLRDGGLITDELTVAEGLRIEPTAGADARALYIDGYAYTGLQGVRAQARLARGALATYAPEVPLSYQSMVYVYEGYAEVFLADLYCSGVPLSTVNFPEGFTYQAGSTTEQVYRHAAVLFDSAISLAVGFDSIGSLARIGLARALIGAGMRDSASKVAKEVSVSSIFSMTVSAGRQHPLLVNVTASDREGRNGLAYVTSFDPRTRTEAIPSMNGLDHYISLTPLKLLDNTVGDSTRVVFASGVEARLIVAEADLARGGTEWLNILNELRTDGSFTVTLRTAIPGVSPGPSGYPDTTWGPGAGVKLIAPSVLNDVTPVCQPSVECADTIWYKGLAPLADPGYGQSDEQAKIARVDLIFRERAFWTHLNGNRAGDLRRLVRQYGREANRVYPTGLYNGPRGVYGNAVSFSIPETERRNPKFKGCIHYGA